MTDLILRIILGLILAAGAGQGGGLVPPETSRTMTGLATHYPACSNCAAASGELQDALGHGWKGRWVTVTNVANGRSVRVRLSTGCGCSTRRYHGHKLPTVIDLSRFAFSDPKDGLGEPLGTGVIEVVVSWGDRVELPATDTAP